LGKGKYYSQELKKSSKSYFIDTHAHLDMLKNKTPEEAVKDARLEDVKYIINVGTSLDGSKKSLEFSKTFDNVFASIGIHPHYAREFGSNHRKQLESMISGANDFYMDETKAVNEIKADFATGEDTKNKCRKVVAVGETGFDFYRNLSPRSDQEKVFAEHIELAIRYNLPVIIHDRDAHNDTLRVVKKYTHDKNFRAVVHCFSGDLDFAMECIDLGLFISFTGVITFPNAKSVLEVIKEIPIERIFIETDAPFLAPQPKRGKENYPEYVKYVACKIAEIKNLPVSEIAEITSKNAEKFFSLSKNKIS
jgi:TatD DNase family protein